jgi:Dullard-like phosphatase family protein
MSDNFHLVSPPTDTVVKPLNLSQALKHSDRDILGRRASTKYLFSEPKIIGAKQPQQFLKDLNGYSIKDSDNPDIKILEYKDLKFHRSDINPLASSQVLLRSECKSELKIPTKMYLKPDLSVPTRPESKSELKVPNRSIFFKTPSNIKLPPMISLLNEADKPHSPRLVYSSSPNPENNSNISLKKKQNHIEFKKTVVLDLDETLVHSSPNIANPDHTINKVLPDGTTMVIKVNVRPFARDFLRTLSSIAEIMIFTAGVKSYADTILNLLDPGGQFITARYYRDSCILSHNGYIKDLSIVKRNLKNVLIVDNLASSFMYNKENGILVNSWYDDKSDKELLNLLKYLRCILVHEDLRKINKNFHLDI